MAPTTVKSALALALSNLSVLELKTFTHRLRDRKQEPRVPRNKVEGKDYLDIVDVLVGTFTEEGAVGPTVEILEEINREVAKELSKDAAALSQHKATDKMHFVDKHRSALIQRVNNIDPILDQLLGPVIQKEAYDRIRAQETRQEKMRKLFDYLESGTRAKDEFYRLLQLHERFLIEELNEQQ